MPANRLAPSVAALPPAAPVTWENTGVAFSGEPVNSETPMASSIAASSALVRKASELGGRAGAAEVEEDDVGCEAERDQRREQVNVGAQDGVELDGAQPLKTGQAAEHLGREGRNGDGLPRAQDTVAQQQDPSGDVAQRTAKASIDVLDDAARDGDSSRELTENSSDGHEEDCTQEECDHSGNGTAAHDHPVADLQNPTGADDGAETDGEEVESESVFFMPPLSSTATSAFLSAIVPLLSF